MLTATLLFIGVAAHAADPDCAESYTAGEIDAVLEEALLSFAILDQEAFEASAAEAVEQVTCLDEPMSTDLAAALHRVQGIRLVVTGQDAEAHTRFRAALTLEPAHVLSETIAPEGGRLANAYSAGRALPIRGRIGLPVPSTVRTIVDGFEVADRPEVGPYVLQVVDPAGDVVQSDYVTTGDPLLDLPPAMMGAGAVAVAAPPATTDTTGIKPSGAPVKPTTDAAMSEPLPEPAPVHEVAETFVAPQPVMAPAPADASSGGMPMSTSSTAKVRKSKGGKGLLVAGLASGAVAAGLYGTAVGSRMQFEDNPTETAWYVTNGAYFGSVGTGALSAVLLSTFVVTR